MKKTAGILQRELCVNKTACVLRVQLKSGAVSTTYRSCRVSGGIDLGAFTLIQSVLLYCALITMTS